MEKSTNDITIEFIQEHPNIKSCLKKGLINYSALSRYIAKQALIEKKTSKEAILIASRRFRDLLKKDISYEKKVKELLEKAEIVLKNKIIVFILEKNIKFDDITEIQKTVKKDFGTFYILEGSDNYTIITQEKYSEIIEKKFKYEIIKKRASLTLINIVSSKDVEGVIGWISYMTSLFAENNVNIVEFLSCWTDTLFVIESKDSNKAMSFLQTS